MFKALKNIFSDKESLVQITQYDSEYLVETYHSSNTGTWLRSNILSKIPLDIDVKELNTFLLHHLNQSKKVNYEKYDLTSVNENYKSLTGKKTIKEQMKDAKQVSIYRDKNTLKICPTINGGTSGKSRGFHMIDDKKIVLDTNQLNSTELAKNVLKLFSECI